MERQSGITSSQIKEAPKDCFYVWVNSDLYYPKMLARKLGRTDIQFVGPWWLESHKWRFSEFTDIIVDHAAVLDIWQIMTVNEIRKRIEINKIHHTPTGRGEKA